MVDTRISGPTMWRMFESTAFFIPSSLSSSSSKKQSKQKSDAEIISEFYKAKRRVLCCVICRNQFRNVLSRNRKLRPYPERFTSREAACELVRQWHHEVNKRLKIDTRLSTYQEMTDEDRELLYNGGFKTTKEWMAWHEANVTLEDYLRNFWDDLWCIVFCLPQKQNCDLADRCQRVYRYLQSVIDLFGLICRDRNHPLLQSHIDALSCYCTTLFTSAQSLVKKLYRVLRDIQNENKGWSLPWMEETIQGTTRSFLLRLLPGLATRVVVVSGPKSGHAPGENNVEEENPTGCR